MPVKSHESPGTMAMGRWHLPAFCTGHKVWMMGHLTLFPSFPSDSHWHLCFMYKSELCAYDEPFVSLQHHLEQSYSKGLNVYLHERRCDRFQCCITLFDLSICPFIPSEYYPGYSQVSVTPYREDSDCALKKIQLFSEKHHFSLNYRPKWSSAVTLVLCKWQSAFCAPCLASCDIFCAALPHAKHFIRTDLPREICPLPHQSHH